MFGNGLIYIASTWLALQIHNSVSAVAILMLFFWVPYITFGPIGGVIADRYSRRSIMVFANCARGILALSLGILLFWDLSLWFIYIFNALIGMLVAIVIPATLSFTPEIVPEKHLLNANANVDLAYEIGNVVGMGSAGIITLILSTQAAFIICGVCFLIATFSIYRAKYTPVVKKEKDHHYSYFKDFREGLSYLKNKKSLFIIYIVQLLLMVDFMTTPVLLAPFAKNFLHATGSQFGFIEASLSIGIITGGLMTPFFVHRLGLKKVVLVELGIMTSAFLAIIFIHRVISAELLYLILGFCLAVWPVLITSAQEQTAKHFQGRLQSNFTTVAGALTIVMFITVTFSSHFTSINHLYWFEVLFTAVAGYLAWLFI